uniref:non-specific serine/threonine protein kinase n=1 Tax=Strongyloides papillosus TaxID=174720 RepID=A0A0N5CHE4_STREA
MFIERFPFVLNEDFTLHSFIADGGYSKVYLGSNRYSCNVAVKMMHLDEEHGINEIKHLSVVANGIVSSIVDNILCGVNLETNSRYIVMEYVKESLESIIAKRYDSTLTYVEIGHINIDILCALEYLSKYKILHLDLKEKNILIRNNSIESGNILLVDFGSAVSLTSDRDCTVNRVYVTLEYAGLYIHESGNPKYSSDIQSLLFMNVNIFLKRRLWSIDELKDKTSLYLKKVEFIKNIDIILKKHLTFEQHSVVDVLVNDSKLYYMDGIPDYQNMMSQIKKSIFPKKINANIFEDNHSMDASVNTVCISLSSLSMIKKFTYQCDKNGTCQNNETNFSVILCIFDGITRPYLGFYEEANVIKMFGKQLYCGASYEASVISAFNSIFNVTKKSGTIRQSKDKKQITICILCERLYNYIKWNESALGINNSFYDYDVTIKKIENIGTNVNTNIRNTIQLANYYLRNDRFDELIRELTVQYSQ